MLVTRRVVLLLSFFLIIVSIIAASIKKNPAASRFSELFAPWAGDLFAAETRIANKEFRYVSYSLSSLNKGYVGDHIGEYYRVLRGILGVKTIAHVVFLKIWEPGFCSHCLQTPMS